MSELKVRFPQLQPVLLRLLQVLHCLEIAMCWEILFGHRLIRRVIRPIYKVLLPHLELSLSLS